MTRGTGTQTATTVTVRVPAKVNLFLGVRGVREDGYHELVTVLQTVGLHDHLTARLVEPRGRGQHPAARSEMGIRLLGDLPPGVPAGRENLVVAAAMALGHRIGLTHVGEVHDDRDPVTVIELSKSIPVAGGMAGGSADAAAALLALDALWGAESGRDGLREVAAAIGSDVPFCLEGGTMLGTGRGTELTKVLARGTGWWVVCEDAEPLSTAAVYRAWDELGSAYAAGPEEVLAAVAHGDLRALGAGLHNDLEPAAFALRPRLDQAKERLLAAGALGAVLSGSGPTLLGLAATRILAERLADEVRPVHRAVHVVPGPAGGPDLTFEGEGPLPRA